MNTPRFQAMDLEFEDDLQKAIKSIKTGIMKGTHNKHFRLGKQGIELVKPRVVLSPGLILSNDQNTVDVDKEMGKLAKNNLLYNAAAQILSKKFDGIKNVIKEGGR